MSHLPLSGFVNTCNAEMIAEVMSPLSEHYISLQQAIADCLPPSHAALPYCKHGAYILRHKTPFNGIPKRGSKQYYIIRNSKQTGDERLNPVRPLLKTAIYMYIYMYVCYCS